MKLLFVVGFFLTFAGGYLGSGIMVGPRLFQPARPMMLVVAVTFATIACIAALVSGFWLFGWWWALIVFVLVGASSYLSDWTRKADAAPGWSMLYMAVGVALMGLAVFFLT